MAGFTEWITFKLTVNAKNKQVTRIKFLNFLLMTLYSH